MNKILKFPDEDALGMAAAAYIVSLSQQSILKHGRFVIALSGGKTPATLYNMLGHLPFSKQMDWKHVFIFWSDERCVPADDEENNSNLARKMLLNHVPIPTENIFPVQVQMEPAKAAEQYQHMLIAFFKNDLPSFDLILLGMGEDGHTASLFPGNDIAMDSPALITSVIKPSDKTARITFTPRLINNAGHIILLITGIKKAGIVQEVIEGKAKNKYPVQLIQPKNKLLWYMDAAAASKLKNNK